MKFVGLRNQELMATYPQNIEVNKNIGVYLLAIYNGRL